MGVPKIAAIALVAIIAVPILLGYAFNLTETTKTEYNEDGQPVNVSQMLMNSIEYSYAKGNIYTLNSNFRISDNTAISYPYYERTVSAGGSQPVELLNYNEGEFTSIYTSLSVWTYSFYIQTGFTPYGYYEMKINDSLDNNVLDIHYVHSAYYDASTTTLSYTYYTSASDPTLITGFYDIPDETYRMGYYTYGTAPSCYILIDRDITDRYVDLSAGYHFIGVPNEWIITLPEYSHSALITINLDSITDSSYSFRLETTAQYYEFTKTTVGSDVSWTVTDPNDPSVTYDLYYDPSNPTNTYQINLQLDTLQTDDTRVYYKTTTDFNYVGSWPSLIGEANYYIKYTDERTHSRLITDPELNMNYLRITNPDNDISRSPTVRMDDAEYRAFTYQIFENRTYSPEHFKINPKTVIKDLRMYGTSISFGGVTYTINQGNITLGTRTISLNNMVLDSIPNAAGTAYENRINGYHISTTSVPSDITFNGKWSANISTNAQIANTYTVTEWHVGQFGWDGIDQNFLMVGLLTCLGVFIALGIYARKRGTGGMIPLLIVVGSAATFFFVML